MGPASAHRKAWEEVNMEEWTYATTKGGREANRKAHPSFGEAQVRMPALERKEVPFGPRMGGKQANRKI